MDKQRHQEICVSFLAALVLVETYIVHRWWATALAIALTFGWMVHLSYSASTWRRLTGEWRKLYNELIEAWMK